MIAKAADLMRGDEFTYDGQLYRTYVNVNEGENQRKIYAYRANGEPGMVIIYLAGTKQVPVQGRDAPPE